MIQNHYQNLWLAAWLPETRAQQNRDGDEEPQFVVCSTKEFRDKEAARWVLSSIANGNGCQIMSDENFVELLEAAEEQDWEDVIRIYNEHNRDSWYIYCETIGIDDGDPKFICMSSFIQAIKLQLCNSE